jgi:UDP-N-acetylmuramate dehydrogenase
MNFSALANELNKIVGLEFQENVPLAPRVYYRIGGKARFLVQVRSPEALVELWKWARQMGCGVFTLGSGTNLLFADQGFDGIVLDMGPLWTEPELIRPGVFRVSARVSKSDLLSWSLRERWGGLEFSAGIPGTIGGAVRMNAGTKWGAYADVLRSVRFVCPERGVFEVKAQDLKLGYRSHESDIMRQHTVVWDCHLELASGSADFDKVLEILSYRGQRQPLEWPSCGSVFKNPESSPKGAGRWIEAAGLKGTRVGNAAVSLQHANFFVNCGNAQASDVQALIKLAQDRVKAIGGPELHPEVIVVDPKNYQLG